MKLVDTFNKNDAGLVDSIKALLDLDERNALVPHGVGGAARVLLTAAAVRLQKNIDNAPWPMLSDLHLQGIVFAYNEGYSKAYDGRIFSNPFTETGSQAAAWELGTRDGNRNRERDLAIAQPVEGSFETLIAVLAAIGYGEQFMEANPELKASAGVARFMDERNTRIKDAWIQSICSASNLTHARASGIVEALWSTIDATETA